MIRVKPARSRIRMSADFDHLVLAKPAAGVLSWGGGAVLGGGLWLSIAMGCAGLAQEMGAEPWVAAAWILALPGFFLLGWGISLSIRSWTFERTADRLRFVRRGLFGRRTREWAAESVSSLWVDPTRVAGLGQPYYVLVVGFRNGRSEDVLGGTDGEEIGWMATMLSDPRGRTMPSPTRRYETAAAPRPQIDLEAVPATLTVRLHPGEVEVAFLPLLHFNRRWWKLLGLTLLCVLALLGIEASGIVPPALTRFGVGVVLASVALQIYSLKNASVIQVYEGIVTIVQNHLQGDHQFRVEEVEFFQTFRHGGTTELQILLKGRPKVRLLSGRPGDELEWAARFLRVALRGSPSSEPERLKVDAKVGECQVCGEKMERRVVYCAKCRTPHHEECWTYVGQCSTYGCREIRFTRV